MTREEVVKWLESLKKEIGKAENRTLWHYAESIDMAIEALSADRPKGKWAITFYDGIMGSRPKSWMCDQCNMISTYKTDFCHNCGADMRGW